MTLDQSCLFTSITQLGFPIGGLLSGYMMTYFGKRYTSIFGQAVSYILGYTLLSTASNVEMLLLGRFLCGICRGFCNCVTVVYILDLCPSKNMVYGALLCLVGNAGTLVTYTIGVFVNWRQLAFISLIISIPYVIGLVICLPNDFPHRKQKSNLDEQKSELKDVFKCKQMYLGIGITFFYQFAGYNIVTNYAGSILQSEGSIQTFGFDSALINATFVGLAGLVGVIIGTILVYWNFERQYILLFSNIGTAMAFLGLGIYQTFLDTTDTMYWIQTLCLVLHCMVFNLGYGCLGYPMVAELFPPKFRSKGVSFLMILSGFFGFLNNSSFDQLKKVMDTDKIYFLYACINLLGFVFLFVFLSKPTKIMPDTTIIINES